MNLTILLTQQHKRGHIKFTKSACQGPQRSNISCTFDKEQRSNIIMHKLCKYAHNNNITRLLMRLDHMLVCKYPTYNFLFVKTVKNGNKYPNNL